MKIPSVNRAAKVLHLIDTGGPGGAETVFTRLAEGLQSRGYESVPVVSRDAWLAEQLRHLQLDPLILSPKIGRFEYLRRILSIIRKENVDIIVAHLLGASLYASLAAIFASKPVIAVFHGQKDIESSRMNRLKGRIVSGPAGNCVFVSENLMNELQPALGIDLHRCVVIPNGVEVQEFGNRSSGLKQRLVLSEDTFLVGAVGNVREPKAYDILLHAAATVCALDDRVVFVVAGEEHPTISAELNRLHMALGLGDRFRFVGLVDDIPEFLAGLDLFTLSSQQEGFSIACVEAMASGLPVVATRSGGPESIIEQDKSGLLVPTGDPVALAEAISGLIVNPAKRAAMGNAARELASTRFSLDSCLDAYAGLLDPLV